MPKPRPKADVLREIEDLGLENLSDVFDTLLAAALGLKVVVLIDQPPPRNSTRLGAGRRVRMQENGKIARCEHCGQPIFENPGEELAAYQYPPDTSIARYLHEHLAGKAKVREEKMLDPHFNIIFAADMKAPITMEEIETAAALEGADPKDWREG